MLTVDLVAELASPSSLLLNNFVNPESIVDNDQELLAAVKSKLQFEIGLEDPELGLVRVARRALADALVYQDANERDIFSIKEILIQNWPYDLTPKVTVHGYRRDRPPVLHFLWRFPQPDQIDYLNDGILDAAYSFLLEIVRESLKPFCDEKLIWANWVTSDKSSHEMVEEEKRQAEKYMVIDFWDPDEVYFEIGGLVSDSPTVSDCVEVYSHITYQMYNQFKNVFRYLKDMQPTKEYLEYREVSLEKNREIKVFVSYSGKYKTITKKILANLSNEKIQFWFDEHEIELGDNINLKIEQGIKESQGLLFFVSPDITDKFYPRAELSLAKEEEQRKSYFIIPVLLDEADQLHVPLELSGRKYLNVLHKNKRINRKSIEHLRRVLMNRSDR